jgi:ferredoxin-NADP reductase
MTVEATAIAPRPAPRSMPAPRPARPDAATPNATIVARDDISSTVAAFRVRPDDGVPAFRPGQYLALGVVADGRPLQRPYSTASPLGEADALEFLVRLVPGGALTPRLWTLRPGARVSLGRPKGLFTETVGDTRRPVFVATGTGIAPLVSMVESRLGERPDGRPEDRPVVIHGAAAARDLAYAHRLREHARRGRITYVAAVSRPADPVNAGWHGATGRVDGLVPAVFAAAGVDPAGSVAYVCGNPGMTEAVGRVLAALGMGPSAIRTEAYWVPPAAGPGSGTLPVPGGVASNIAG